MVLKGYNKVDIIEPEKPKDNIVVVDIGDHEARVLAFCNVPRIGEFD